MPFLDQKWLRLGAIFLLRTLLAERTNFKLSKFCLVRQQIGLLNSTLQDPLAGSKPLLSQFLTPGVPFLIIGSLILSSMSKCFAVLLKMDSKKAATKKSETFMSNVCPNYKDGLGLRFTTQNWQPGFISNVLQKIQKDEPWEYKEKEIGN